MKLAILETGAPPDPLHLRFGRYPDMFRRTFDFEGAQWSDFDVRSGDMPERAEDFDALFITGSSSGVYDGEPWIDDLKAYLQAAEGRTRLVGVCFGHQVMAEAFGGKVEKSDKGWGVGLHDYAVVDSAPWMDAAREIAIPASHQDQVVEPPPGTRVLVSSAFTPFAVLEWNEHPAISMQFHPEFEPDYAKALIERRRGVRYTDDQADAAIASLSRPNDRARVAGWVRRFLLESSID